MQADADQIFNGRQLEALNSYRLPQPPSEPALLPASLFVILKATRLCNLRCTYCHAWREGPNQVLPFERLLDVVAQSMRLPGVRLLHFVWHGGETTLLSRRFFQRAIWLQEHFRIDDRKVSHAIQTNATRIDADWADFFRAAGFSVGVSLDLDAANHDRSRVFQDGSGSYAATRRGIDILEARGVKHGVLAVVDRAALDMGAPAVLEQLHREGVRNVGLLNALPANDDDGAQAYLSWEDYTRFLSDLFKTWRAEYRDKLVLRELDSLFRIVSGAGSRLCLYQGGCMGQYLTIEPDGRVSACDKYVGDEAHCFGDLRISSLHEILSESPALADARRNARRLAQGFRTCRNFEICRGGCPHDARLNAAHGVDGDCCGLDDLIDQMKSAAGEETDHGYHHA